MRAALGGEENSHDMIKLLPAVQRLLVLLAALLNENVDDTGVGHVAVLLKVSADAVSDVGGGDIECVEGADFWGLTGV